MSKALLFSDSHSRRRIDEQFALKQISKAAKKHKVDIVIGAGDLIDKQSNRSDPIKTIMNFVNSLEQAEIPFWYLQGQHEADDPSWLSCHKWANHLHKNILNIGPCTAYGLDFTPFGKLQEELAEIPRSCDMLIAHQCWGNWMGDIAVPQGEFEQIPGHVGMVYTGDLHQWRLEKADNADGAQMLVCSTGATTMQKIDEPSEHYYTILEYKTDLFFKKIPLLSRVFIDWPLIVIQEDLTKFMEEIEDTLAKAYQQAASMDLPDEMYRPRLRISYSYRIPETVRRVTKVVGDRALLYWKEVAPKEKLINKNPNKKKSNSIAATPLNVLSKAVDKDEKSEVFELASRLLQANNYEDEFQHWWSEQLGD